MSIEKHVVLFSRAFRSLIKKTRRLAKPIKDLKDLRALRGHACYRHVGPTDLKDVFSVARTMARDRPSPYGDVPFFPRSAGACPPRSPSSSYVFRSVRTYMSIEKHVVLFSRAFRSLIKTRAALAKPIKDLKDLSVLRGRAGYRHSGSTDLKNKRRFSVARAMARDRPSPYDEVPFFPVARGPVTRERHHQDMPS